jgi:hypothetical protein
VLNDDYFVRVPAGVDLPDARQSVVISPNPSNGRFSVTSDPTVFTGISIYDMAGVKVFTTNVVSLKTEVDLGGKPKGVYLLQAVSPKTTVTRKVIIR